MIPSKNDIMLRLRDSAHAVGFCTRPHVWSSVWIRMWNVENDDSVWVVVRRSVLDIIKEEPK